MTGALAPAASFLGWCPTIQLDCTCTDGANAGSTFSVKSCEALFSDNLWNRCNVK
ncbi:MAG: hypothetical protein U0359_35025 [Byssovorax sp.]